MDEELAYQTAQLRHAYNLLSSGRVKDHLRFADGFLAPAIKYLERKAQAQPN